MKTSKQPVAIVITPTIGRPELKYAIESVSNQTYSNVLHLVVIDGIEFNDPSRKILKEFKKNNKIKYLTLPFNTGKQGFYGHRIYAAFSHLVNADYIFFLDEDNWYDVNHVETLIDTIKRESLDWAYSLRKIYNQNNEFISNDDCESLGDWPPFSGLENLVDTSAYAIKREVLIKVAHLGVEKFGADRKFFHELKKFSPRYMTTSLYTMNYKLQESKIPGADFFLVGNKYMVNKYKGNLPWKKLNI